MPPVASQIELLRVFLYICASIQFPVSLVAYCIVPDYFVHYVCKMFANKSPPDCSVSEYYKYL